MIKILSTIGPATEKEKDLRKVLKFSDFIRLNGAHGSLVWHKKITNLIKKINPNCRILIDFPGIKPRTMNSSKVYIKKNTLVKFFYKKNYKIRNTNYIPIPISRSLPKFKNPKFFTVSDGRYKFKFFSKGKNFLIGKSLQNFVLKSQKGLNIPFSIYDNHLQEKVYLKFLEKIKKYKIDAIGLSYVQNSELIEKIKKKTDHIIVSKIENIEGCKNLKKICVSSDIIMIDRGDLSAEIGEENLFRQTTEISNCAKSYGKLLIMATENLDSMMNNNSPSKSEIISLGFSKILNADYLMLSDETATSNRFMYILKWLDNFNNKKSIESISKNKQIKKKNLNIEIFYENLSNIDNQNTNVVLFTRKGYIIEKLLKKNPKLNLIVFTDNKRVYDLSSLRANSRAFLVKKFPRAMDKFIYNSIKKNLKLIFKDKNLIYLVYATFARKQSRANTISVLERKDFLDEI